MPLFEFNCGKCGVDFEDLVFGNSLSKVRCPACGASKAKKKMSVFGFKSGTVFSGSSGHSCDCGGSCKKKHCTACGH